MGSGATRGSASAADSVDAIDLAVLSSRLDSIVREMESTVLRTARSSVVGLSKDFSCSILSSDDELLATAEGLPIHVYGSHLLARSMRRHHPEFAPGDAFLHNDPYDGNTHAADQSVLVPVFFADEHVFTVCVKAHQADIGNSLPTTYMAGARNVYEEGALIFPCVRIQHAHTDEEDIIRMAQRRIRVPEVWFGDYLAALAACRVAEEHLQELCGRFAIDRVRTFVRAWLDYSESRAREAIRELPGGALEITGGFDPFPGVEEGISVRVKVDVDVVRGGVRIDLRDNPDCVSAGLNLTEATARSSAIAGMLLVLNASREAAEARVPLNAGSFRCFEVMLREGCVVGIPRHPVSCSMATGGPSATIMALILAAFAREQEGLGAGLPPFGAAPYLGVISGTDPVNGQAYITQFFCGTAGGPATGESDGWLSFVAIAAAGLLYRDSVEVDEQKYPIVIACSRVRPDSEGAGRWRGGPGNLCEYGPRRAPMQVFYALEGIVNRSEGVRGGLASSPPSAFLRSADGSVAELPQSLGAVEVQPGERIGSRSAGGGGYGDPHQREPAHVLQDVREGVLSVARAGSVYGVAIRGDPDRFETLEIDRAKTRKLRTPTDEFPG